MGNNSVGELLQWRSMWPRLRLFSDMIFDSAWRVAEFSARTVNIKDFVVHFIDQSVVGWGVGAGYRENNLCQLLGGVNVSARDIEAVVVR